MSNGLSSVEKGALWPDSRWLVFEERATKCCKSPRQVDLMCVATDKSGTSPDWEKMFWNGICIQQQSSSSVPAKVFAFFCRRNPLFSFMQKRNGSYMVVENSPFLTRRLIVITFLLLMVEMIASHLIIDPIEVFEVCI